MSTFVARMMCTGTSSQDRAYVLCGLVSVELPAIERSMSL